MLDRLRERSLYFRRRRDVVFVDQHHLRHARTWPRHHDG
jgi:hypothetical protein